MTMRSPSNLTQAILECSCAWFIGVVLGLVVIHLWPTSFIAIILSVSATFIAKAASQSPEIVVLLCVAAVTTMLATSAD